MKNVHQTALDDITSGVRHIDLPTQEELTREQYLSQRVLMEIPGDGPIKAEVSIRHVGREVRVLEAQLQIVKPLPDVSDVERFELSPRHGICQRAEIRRDGNPAEPTRFEWDCADAAHRVKDALPRHS